MTSTKTPVFFKKLLGIIVLIVMVYVPCVYASDMTSASFIIRDPIVGTGGGYGTSSSFKMFSAGNITLSDGAGTSSSFKVHEGFLYYPFVDDVTLSAVPNGSSADLSWPAANYAAGLGWTVSGYKTGIKPSGGSYTFTLRGNVTSYSYTNLTPGDYCFQLQTLDNLNYVIATSNEVCLTIQPILTFSNDDNAIGFGTLSTAGARYATANAVGSGSDSTYANRIVVTTNAPNGYTLTYYGPTLTSGANTIPAATIGNDPDGSPGTSQFALSATISGTGSIAAGYEHANSPNPNWKFVTNTVSNIATASGVVSSDTIDMRYIGNISDTQAAGSYDTSLEMVVTGNF